MQTPEDLSKRKGFCPECGSYLEYLETFEHDTRRSWSVRCQNAACRWRGFEDYEESFIGHSVGQNG